MYGFPITHSFTELIPIIEREREREREVDSFNIYLDLNVNLAIFAIILKPPSRGDDFMPCLYIRH